MQQSVLALNLPYLPTLSDVQIGANGAAIHAAKAWLEAALTHPPLEPNARCILSWGARGTGKSLIAKALSHAANAAFLHPSSTEHDFSNAHAALCVVVDDIHAFDDARATAAFDVFNRLRESPHGYWWATSRVPPQLMVNLRADVSSRMAWGPVFELQPLDDAACAQVLQTQAQQLGFSLIEEAALYLLFRLERNLSDLAQHLASLNHYALSLKKPVSSHLIQQWYAQVYLPQLQTHLL